MKQAWINNKVHEIQETQKPPYVCASGISVSGVLHPGKLRDIFIANQIHSELQERKLPSKLIYFVDDFDRFKKPPKDLPEFAQYIGSPYSAIPSPSNDAGSFVDHYFQSFIENLHSLDIHPELVYESSRFKNGEYNEEMKTLFENRKLIQTIYKSIRDIDIDSAKLFNIYCESCEKENPTHKILNPDETMDYACDCGYEGNISIYKPGHIKPAWFVNWPSRWNKENTSFEPIGPDHASSQSCFEVSSQIYEAVFGRKTPTTQVYGFVNLKGGIKLSSTGTNLSLDNLLSVFDPQVIQWLFSSKNPQTFFDIDMKNPFHTYRKADTELAIDLPSFRSIVSKINANLGDYTFDSDQSNQLRDRVQRAKTWAETYSPKDSRFALLDKPNERELTQSEREFRQKLIHLKTTCPLESNLEFQIFELMKAEKVDRKKQFSALYKDLTGEKFGPKLHKVLLKTDDATLRKLLL